MKKFQKLVILTLPVLFSFFSSCGQIADKNNNKVMVPSISVPTTTEEKQFEGGSVKIPGGWKIFQTGSCSEMSFISWDPTHPGRQFFYYGVGGFFYLTAQQRQMDDNYVAMGGMRTPLNGKPVINPLTPENFIRSFYLLADPSQAQMGQKIPEMYNVQVVSVTPQPSGMPNAPATAALVRALFTNRNNTQLSEGIFLVTVVPMYLSNYGPGASFGIAYSFMGITAPFNELEALLPSLNKCMESFALDQSYVNNCMRISDARTAATLKAGKTLSEASGNMAKAWQNRARSEDIISQKRSDAMMGRERLYDPQTKTVYEVDNTFIDKYKMEPGKFNYSNLQRLPPGDVNLWKQPLVNGADHIKRIN